MAIRADTKATKVRWFSCNGGDVIPQHDNSAIFIASAPGRYRVLAWVCSDGEPSEAAQCWITVGTSPVPPPVPPVPPVPPTPPTPPAPIPLEGFRVLIVYETAELGRLTGAQRAILTSTKVREYLAAKCAKDGTQPAFRVYDKDVVPELPWLKDAFKRPRSSLPWIVVSDGKTGYEGVLPADVDATLELLRKYGGS